jgi:cell division protein ZapE
MLDKPRLCCDKVMIRVFSGWFVAQLLEKYNGLVKTGVLQADGHQLEIVHQLDELCAALGQIKPKSNGRLLARFFGHGDDEPRPRGIYLWGDVGRGKTMLMDLFFDVVPVEAKRRDHFLSFMQSVHAEIFAIRQRQKAGQIWEEDDPVKLVAKEIADKTWLLCFDEFQVADITDAMILGRLFAALFKLGVVVVSTSNRPPDDLYKDGLNRHAFLPFIERFKQQMEVVGLDNPTDYRLEKLAGEQVYLTPLSREADIALQKLWRQVTETERGKAEVLEVQGRKLVVPGAARSAARFSFADLCEQPLGGADYIAIASNYATVFIEHIPILGSEQSNEAKRFITMIDAFYDRGIKLVVTADAPPQALYTEGSHLFEFGRTASRLSEMQSHDYWSKND